MSHFKLNPPPYVAREPKFIGVPGLVYGDILTDEAQQAFNVIRAFGAQGPAQQKYVSYFFNGDANTPGEPQTRQLVDIDEHFSLQPTAEKAVNNGTANTRGEFLTGMTIAGGLDAQGKPVAGIGACQSTSITIAKVGSEYAGICARFQHNLNVGADGG